jgi:hypothetical protein
MRQVATIAQRRGRQDLHTQVVHAWPDAAARVAFTDLAETFDSSARVSGDCLSHDDIEVQPPRWCRSAGCAGPARMWSPALCDPGSDLNLGGAVSS